ncbi:MAG: aminoglycoside phosphotransferase family protein [Eggerthellaceae bacterium]|nr:aminoglycoside phosphotransferase family protein [Eggerthellaceae bacterium]
MRAAADAVGAAARYLASNADLREAVGARDGELLVPHPLGEGEHNQNFWFSCGGKRFVLRVNVAPQPFHDNQVRYEFDALGALTPSGCTPRPLYLDDGPDAPAHGALVTSFCPGRQLDFDHLRPGDLERVAALMAAVHAVPVAPACPLHRPADPLRRLLDECVARYRLYRESPFEDARVTAWAERFLQAAARAVEDAPPERGARRIINTEPLASHFLLDPDARADGGLGGWYLDWERPVLGEVAQDVAYFLTPAATFWDSDHLITPDEAANFVEDYWRAVDGRLPREGFDARFPAYLALSALRSVTWCCRALITYRPGSDAHQTDKAAAKLPVLLSDDFMELMALQCLPR